MKLTIIFSLASICLFAQQMADNPRPGETETPQVGGAGFGSYSFVGSLRCNSPSDAIVGARSRKGAVVDYIQIACAPVTNASWSTPYWGKSAGNAQGGGAVRTAMCPAGSAIAGYAASATPGNLYMQDIRFDCAKIVNTGANAINVSQQRQFVAWSGGSGDALGSGSQSECQAGAASAFSVAVGRFVGASSILGGGSQVVQAFSLMCRGTSTTTPMQGMPARQPATSGPPPGVPKSQPGVGKVLPGTSKY